MNVQSQVVSEEVISSLLERMKQGPFRSFEIEGLAERLGFDRRDGTAMRVADRLIQRERKAGNIVFDKRPTWKWVEGR